MEEAYLQELLGKYRSGSLSAAEKQQLDKWYLDKAVEEGFRTEPLVVSQRLAELHEAFAFVHAPAVKKIRLWPRIAVAASIALAVITGGYFYVNRLGDNRSLQMAQNDIAPGKNGATLTLASGKRILISDALAGNIASEAGVRIAKTSSGEIIYEVTGDNAGERAYNTLSTSRGQQSQVRLPDGSVVFLNAESSLRYPTSFAKQQTREVALTGEGYFEVAKDKSRPFKVSSGGQLVEVLGTHFNVNSYGDAGKIKTTLVEGSVQVSGALALAKLVPGEQASFAGGKIWVEKADIEEAVAWKNGYFMFNEESLGQIMQVVARWYNIEVEYQDASLKALAFWGSVSRFVKVGRMLRILESTGKVRFEVQGNKIIVSRF